MGELLTTIVEQYAIRWEELGRKLGLTDYQLANISENNSTRLRRVETCCRDVLEKWLKEISSPTWGKLDDVIKSLTIAPVSTSHRGSVLKYK